MSAARHGPSRLWRVLGASAPVFEVESASFSGSTIRDDRTITGISIEGGTAMRGMSTAGATITLRGTHSLSGIGSYQVRVRLSDHGAARLQSLTGRTADYLRSRFSGRLAAQEITDNGEGRPAETKLTGQDWVSYISQIDKGAYADRQEPSVWRLYRSLFTQAQIPDMYSLTYWGAEWHWVKFTAEDTGQLKHISTGDVLEKYAAELGNLIRTDRAGTPAANSHDNLVSNAKGWRTFFPDPLQRRHVLRPVSWSRQASIPVLARWTEYTPQAEWTPVQRVLYPRVGGGVPPLTQETDMTHVLVVGNGLRGPMAAAVAAASHNQLAVERVTVDVLGLLERDEGTDRLVVGHLLAMQHGDPVPLGYDWPTDVRGVYFAESITHSITASSWTIELVLTPSEHVTGSATPTDIAGRTWDTAMSAYRWDNAETTWETTP